MPEICRFFGIIVSLYWKDHNPPHIHFSYGDYECSISVLDRVVDGQAPVKVIAKVNFSAGYSCMFLSLNVYLQLKIKVRL
jgi:hypothetical protein